jgi:hypothetical protein
VTTTVLAYFPSPAQGVWYLGPFPVRAYALCIIAGIIAALVIGDRRWAARGGERGVVYDIALWAVPFGLIGGRLYHVLTDWKTYFGEGGAGLGAALRIWEGGLGIWGAIALGGIGAWIACRRRGIPLPAFGDAVAPGIVLAHALASIVTREGKVLVPGLLPDGIPDSIREVLIDCAPRPEPGEPSIDEGWGEPGLTTAEKLYAWNTFEVLAFRTGNPDNPVNAIPGRATATCQVRFVAGCDPRTFVPILRSYLDAAGFPMVRVSPARSSFMAATRMDPKDPWVQWAAESMERTTGERPAILPNIGGSLPNDCFAHVLGLPTLWVPHSYAGCSQHAPDEHVLAPVLREGLQLMTGLFWDLGEKDAGAAIRA